MIIVGKTFTSRQIVLVRHDGTIAYRNSDYTVGSDADWNAILHAVTRLPPPPRDSP